MVDYLNKRRQGSPRWRNSAHFSSVSSQLSMREFFFDVVLPTAGDFSSVFAAPTQVDLFKFGLSGHNLNEPLELLHLTAEPILVCLQIDFFESGDVTVFQSLHKSVPDIARSLCVLKHDLFQYRARLDNLLD